MTGEVDRVARLQSASDQHRRADKNQHTLHYDVITFPPVARISKQAGRNPGSKLPFLPRSPILPKIPRITEHVCTKSLVHEYILAIGVDERLVSIIVVFGENHDIVGRAFPEQKVVCSLIHVKKRILGQMRPTPVETPDLAEGLARVMVKTPSGTFCRVAVHDHCDVDTPDILDGSEMNRAVHEMLAIKGVELLAEVWRVRLLVTLSQSITTSNSREILIVIASESRGLARIR